MSQESWESSEALYTLKNALSVWNDGKKEGQGSGPAGWAPDQKTGEQAEWGGLQTQTPGTKWNRLASIC